MRHLHSGPVLDTLFCLYANEQQKSKMVRCFYGVEFNVLVSGGAVAVEERDSLSLLEVVRRFPLKKDRILNQMKEILVEAVGKEDALRHEMIHRVFHDFFSLFLMDLGTLEVASETSTKVDESMEGESTASTSTPAMTATEEPPTPPSTPAPTAATQNQPSSPEHNKILQKSLNSLIFSSAALFALLVKEMPSYVHTKFGSRVAAVVIAVATAKDRKLLVKYLKPHVAKIASDDCGWRVLARMLTCLDDTVLGAQAILHELSSSLPLSTLLCHKQVRKVVEVVLRGGCRLDGGAEELKLEKNILTPLCLLTSKKPQPIRSQELLSLWTGKLSEMVAEEKELGALLRHPLGATSLLELSQRLPLDSQRQLSVKIASLVASEPLALSLLTRPASEAPSTTQKRKQPLVVATVDDDASDSDEDVTMLSQSTKVISLENTLTPFSMEVVEASVPLLLHFHGSRILKRLVAGGHAHA